MRHFAAVLLLPVFLLSGLLRPVLATAQTLPTRYLVTYRSGTIPTQPAPGTRVLARHEHLGIAVLETANPTSLERDPNIEFIAQDRLAFAHQLAVKAIPTITAKTTSASDSFYFSPQGWAVRAVGGYGSFGSNTPVSDTIVGPWTITRGRGIRIAILDSGVDPNHPDIAPNLALNLSEIDPAALPTACDDGSPFDQQGHGTWTASLAAAALGPGTGEVAGVAPEAQILNIKIMQRMPATPTAADPTGCNAGQAAGLLSWILQGIDDAVANRADIISLSLGTLVDITTSDGAGLKATFDHATHAAFAAGTLVIAAAGNDGFDLGALSSGHSPAPRYIELPAQARDVLAIVAATNSACQENLAPGATCVPGPVTRPYYSNFGTPLNALAAPGGSYPAGPDADPTQATGWIRGACSQGKPATQLGPPADIAHSEACFGLGRQAYVQAMGTSAAAPLAAGVAALLRAAHPTWDAATIVATLRSSATSLPGLAVPQITAAIAVAPANPIANPVQGTPMPLH